MNIVEHGMARMKHSSDCYAVLLKELKILANSGMCKLMVLIDSVNQFYRKPQVLHPDGRYPSVEELTLPRALMKLYRDQNWVSCDYSVMHIKTFTLLYSLIFNRKMESSLYPLMIRPIR